MTQDEQITKILELEQHIRDKQTSIFSAHTLVPISLVLGLIGSVFFFGITFQRLQTAEGNLSDLKVELKSINQSVQDLRILILGNPNLNRDDVKN